MKLALTGMAIGLVAAFALTRLIKDLLFGVTADRPIDFCGDCAVADGSGACWPATCRHAERRRVDPLSALRHE